MTTCVETARDVGRRQRFEIEEGVAVGVFLAPVTALDLVRPYAHLVHGPDVLGVANRAPCIATFK